MSPIQKITLENEIEALHERNRRVDLDKAWETSTARKIAITVITYIVVFLYFNFLNVANAYLHAAVPAAGYLFSTFTLPLIKRLWAEKLYQTDQNYNPKKSLKKKKGK